MAHHIHCHFAVQLTVVQLQAPCWWYHVQIQATPDLLTSLHGAMEVNLQSLISCLVATNFWKMSSCQRSMSEVGESDYVHSGHWPQIIPVCLSLLVLQAGVPIPKCPTSTLAWLLSDGINIVMASSMGFRFGVTAQPLLKSLSKKALATPTRAALRELMAVMQEATLIHSIW